MNNKITLGLAALLATANCFCAPFPDAMNAVKSGNLHGVIINYDKLQGPGGAIYQGRIDTYAQKNGLGSIATIRALLATSEILVKALVDAAQAYHSNASAATDVQLEEAYLALKDKKLVVPPAAKTAFDAALAHAATQY